MRYLGIDYGSKRIGVAVSDTEGRIALPRKVIEGGIKELRKELRELLREGPIAKIVVGLPLALDGRETDETREVKNFAEKLRQKWNIPVEFENEMLTTKIAEEGGAKKELVDASSAAIILQSYLDRKNRNS